MRKLWPAIGRGKDLSQLHSLRSWTKLDRPKMVGLMIGTPEQIKQEKKAKNPASHPKL